MRATRGATWLAGVLLATACGGHALGVDTDAATPAMEPDATGGEGADDATGGAEPDATVASYVDAPTSAVPQDAMSGEAQSDASTAEANADATTDASDEEPEPIDAGEAGAEADVSTGAEASTDAADASLDGATCTDPVSSGTRAVAYQIDAQHTGAQPTDTLALPLCRRWTATFPGGVSYPLIADGRVLVTAATSLQSTVALYALDEHTGSTLWGPVALGGTYPWANAAYDDGRVFAVNTSGVLAAFDASTGSSDWSVALPGQYLFSSPPTALNGTVYVGGAGSGGTLYAVDEAVGTVLWTATVENGDNSSPAVSAGGVYVSYACNQAYGFDPGSGASLWHFSGPCEGGGGKTPVLFGDLVYTRDAYAGDLILSATTGTQTGTYVATTIPAFSGDQTFRQSSGTLSAASLTSGATAWSFAGDGSLRTAPLVVGSNVVIGSGSGTLFVVDAVTGQTVSSTDVGAPIPAPDEQNISQPLTGMAEADGVLVVSAGTTVVAY